MRIGRVDELFTVFGRGVVVVTDLPWNQFPEGFKLRNGDAIEFRDGDAVVLRSVVAAIDHPNPWTPQTPLSFLLPTDVSKEAVASGWEIWQCDK